VLVATASKIQILYTKCRRGLLLWQLRHQATNAWLLQRRVNCGFLYLAARAAKAAELANESRVNAPRIGAAKAAERMNIAVSPLSLAHADEPSQGGLNWSG
jgi:hypothetical protein